MADEEVKIRISESRQGDAIRETTHDLEQLEKAKRKAAASPAPAATHAPATPARAPAPASAPVPGARRYQPPRRMSMQELEAKYGTPDPQAAKDAKGTLRADIRKTKEAAASTKLEEEQARAAGRTEEADALAREVQELEAAVALQQKLGVSQAEALTLARASISAKAKIANQTQEEIDRQKKLTEEKKRQQAYEKANVRGWGRVTQFGQQVLGGGQPSLTSMLNMGGGVGNMSGVAGMIGRLSVAVTAAVMAWKGFMDSQDKDAALQHQQTEDRARDARGLRRKSGIFGSSSSLVSSSVDTKEEIEERLAHRESLQHKGKTSLSWYNPTRWSDELFGTDNWKYGGAGWGVGKSDAARDIEANEERIKQLEWRKGKERVEARKKFLAEEGGLELSMRRNIAQHDMPGLKAARQDEGVLRWMKEYKRIAAESGDDALAKESGDLAVKEWQRDLRLRAASGMVDARSGGADIARAADIASMTLPDSDKLARGIEAMHGTLKSKLDDLSNIAGRQSFSH